MNNPENFQKTSRTDYPEPSLEKKRPTEDGRKSGEAVHVHKLTRGSRGSVGGGGSPPGKAELPEVWLAKSGKVQTA